MLVKHLNNHSTMHPSESKELLYSLALGMRLENFQHEGHLGSSLGKNIVIRYELEQK